MRWKALALAALLAVAPVAAEAGPTFYGLLGVENPAGETGDTDLLARGGGGLEWLGVFDNPDWAVMGQYAKIGWADPDMPDTDRWNYALKVYLTSYWPEANPWIAIGIEHQGKGFLFGHENLTWLVAGFEPRFAGGWIQPTLQAVGVGMERETEWRVALDLIPRKAVD